MAAGRQVAASGTNLRVVAFKAAAGKQVAAGKQAAASEAGCTLAAQPQLEAVRGGESAPLGMR